MLKRILKFSGIYKLSHKECVAVPVNSCSQRIQVLNKDMILFIMLKRRMYYLFNYKYVIQVQKTQNPLEC